MTSKIFNDSVLRKKFFMIVSVIVIINTISLVVCYNLKIKPTFEYNNYVKTIIEQKELKDVYEDEEQLISELERISKKYNAKFRVIDENRKNVLVIKVKNSDFFLFSDVVMVGEDVYIINAYLHHRFGMTSMVVSLIAFQIFVIFILMISTYYATGKTIINPIQKVVNDIRNYKLGKKPVRNEVNTELDIIQNEFVNLVNSLEEEKKEQNRIIASISHDIKTPLTSIIGYSDLMNDEQLTLEEARKYSVKINEKAIHIKNILGTFDDYLINYDNKKLNLTDVCVKDIVKELNDDYKIELSNNKINFNVSSKCNNEHVMVDVLKLKRIFSNIISNSIRFVPENGYIHVVISKEGKFLKFVVKDNGCGVDDEVIDKIFDPFFTTDPSRKISGLGLSICKEFIEMHGGKIKAKNDNGLIIEFTLSLDPLKDK